VISQFFHGGDESMNDQQPAEQVGFWIGILIGGAIAGAVCGLLPFFVARNYGRPTFATWSLVGCIAAGLVLGLIGAVPTAIILTVIVAIQGKPPQTIDV
jgi:hypothetical protein